MSAVLNKSNQNNYVYRYHINYFPLNHKLTLDRIINNPPRNQWKFIDDHFDKIDHKQNFFVGELTKMMELMGLVNPKVVKDKLGFRYSCSSVNIDHLFNFIMNFDMKNHSDFREDVQLCFNGPMNSAKKKIDSELIKQWNRLFASGMRYSTNISYNEKTGTFWCFQAPCSVFCLFFEKLRNLLERLLDGMVSNLTSILAEMRYDGLYFLYLEDETVFDESGNIISSKSV